MNVDWRRELHLKYPQLFKTSASGPGAYAGPLEIGDGWQNVVARACARIAATLAGTSGRLTFSQIKEKFGSIRIYWDGDVGPEAAEAIADAIALAEARSACTCETCGAEGRLYVSMGWRRTACDDHAKGDPVPRRRGWENIHVVRGYVDGKVFIKSCRRYDRDTDTFTDVDPASLGLKE